MYKYREIDERGRSERDLLGFIYLRVLNFGFTLFNLEFNFATSQ